MNTSATSALASSFRTRPGIAALALALTCQGALPAAAQPPAQAATPPSRSASGHVASAVSAAEDSGANATFFPVGERLEYAIVLGRVHLGTATMTVEAEERVAGARVFRTSLDIRIRVALLRHEERLVSWIEPTPFRSRLFEKREGGEEGRRHLYTFFPEDRTVSLEIRTPEGEALGPPELLTAVPRNAVDELAALYLLRLLTVEEGETENLDRYFDPTRERMEVTHLGSEKVRVPAGRFQTLVFRTVMPALSTFRAESEPRVYISDDDRRLIVQMDTDTKVGRLSFYLTDYRPSALARR